MIAENRTDNRAETYQEANEANSAGAGKAPLVAPQAGLSVKTWLWFFPLTFLIHISEEYWGGGGFSAYMARARGVNLSPNRFLFMNGLAFVLMMIGVVLARRLNFAEWLAVCLGSVILVNGLSHTINTLVSHEYNPGVVSGLLIWIPFGAWVLIHLKRRMSGRRYWVAILVGGGIHAVVSLLALTGGNPLRLLMR